MCVFRLENLEEDDLEVIRRQRMEQMKKAQKDRIEMLSHGHGKYEEVADEKEFFEATKKSDKVVCLFYLPGNFRCKIVDKHFEILARKHVGTRFIHVNAEKVHFLTTRLNIRVIPSIAIVVVSLNVVPAIVFFFLKLYNSNLTSFIEFCWHLYQII